MKSAGHAAYDAFRKETPWLLPWESLPDALRLAWEEVANKTMDFNSAEAPL
jgi:hypothetical protein